MARMLTPDPLVEEENKPEEKPAVNEESGEFEYVLGRRQVASVGLVLLTGLAAFTAAAYMVGKSTAAPAKQEKAVDVPATLPAPKPAAAVQAPVTFAPQAQNVDPSILDAPLSGVPETGHLYIQLASVERGFATLMVYGTRKLGFPAFIATGASPVVYRVLSGPFPDKESYEKAKATFQAAGLNTFTRKFTGEEESKSVMPTPDESVQP